MYTKQFIVFSRAKRSQPTWQFPAKVSTAGEAATEYMPQPDWDFTPRTGVNESPRLDGWDIFSGDKNRVYRIPLVELGWLG